MRKPVVKVINRDKNGKTIKDLSKVVLPIELSKEIYELINPDYKAV